MKILKFISALVHLMFIYALAGFAIEKPPTDGGQWFAAMLPILLTAISFIYVLKSKPK